MFLFFLFNFVFGLPYEVCLKFPLDFNLYECTHSPLREISEINWIPPMKECPNLGTWDCATFKCFWPNPEGFCRYGEIDYGDCCTFKEIHYVGMWFEPNDNSGVDWELDIFNLEIKGIGDDICIHNGDTTCFEDVFNNMGMETYISVIIEYNETCTTNIIISKNGSRILNVTGHDLDLFIDVFFTTIIRSMVEIDNEGYNEKLYRVSAHTVAPTEEQELEIYNLGSNRSPDIEICFYSTLDELDDCQETLSITQYGMETLNDSCTNTTEQLYAEVMKCYSTHVPLFWMIIAIVLMGIFVIILIVFFIWLIYRLFMINRESGILPTNKSIGKNVYF